ncbi:MAG: ATP-dependent helicase [Actinomycetota bacterium]
MGETADIFAGLNEAQLEAVQTPRGPVAIIAGAGTGKTTTITRRIAHQISTQAFDPRQILAVTFSKKAATELGDRLRDLGVPSVRAMTFHAEALAQFRRFVDEETQIISSKAMVLHGLVKRLPKPYRFMALRDLATEIEWAKNRRISQKDYETAVGDRKTPIPADMMMRLYRDYQKALRSRKAMDFEDLLEQLLRHLSENDRDLGIVRGRYRSFTVDEYQDVNLLQESLLREWVGARDDLCVVGDDYQSIYGFTGASPKYLLDFERRYPNAHVFTLTENHRSTPQILQLANLLVPSLGGSSKRLVPTLPAGPEALVRRFSSGEDETEAIVAKIQGLLEAGTPAHQIAILVRINARTEPFEEALSAARIPYQVRDGSFLRRPAARGFLAGARRYRDPAVVESVQAITDALGFDPKPDDDLPDEEATRQQDLSRLRVLAGSSTAPTLEDFVAELRARFDSDQDGVGVVLMTLHRSKGLEFDAVFLPRLEEGELPIRHAKTAEDVAEERRLFYVGLTRARRHLWVSMARSRPDERRSKSAPSRFLDEVSPPAIKVGTIKRTVSPPAVQQIPDSDPLFQALRTWRRDTAAEAKMPAYIVFTDATLKDIARHRPKDRDGLRAISGVGPLKMRRYGEQVLGILADHACRT